MGKKWNGEIKKIEIYDKKRLQRIMTFLADDAQNFLSKVTFFMNGKEVAWYHEEQVYHKIYDYCTAILPMRIIKITSGMIPEFEIISTDAPDHVIKAQLMYISACEEEGKQIPVNPYGMIQEFGYIVNVLGCQDDFTFDDEETLIIDAEFDYYSL